MAVAAASEEAANRRERARRRGLAHARWVQPAAPPPRPPARARPAPHRTRNGSSPPPGPRSPRPSPHAQWASPRPRPSPPAPGAGSRGAGGRGPAGRQAPAGPAAALCLGRASSASVPGPPPWRSQPPPDGPTATSGGRHPPNQGSPGGPPFQRAPLQPGPPRPQPRGPDPRDPEPAGGAPAALGRQRVCPVVPHEPPETRGPRTGKAATLHHNEFPAVTAQARGGEPWARFPGRPAGAGAARDERAGASEPAGSEGRLGRPGKRRLGRGAAVRGHERQGSH